MSDDWDFYHSRVDNEPASIFVDLGIAQNAPNEEYPNLGYVRVSMREQREDGLSSQQEYDKLIAIEDALDAKLSINSASVYVGRNTSNGNRDFYFYHNDQQSFKE